MSDRPESKRHLGRILLQRKVVTPDGLSELLRQQALQGGRLASKAVELGKADSADVLGALSEQQGLPAIDLRRLVLPLANLRLLSVEAARKHSILPLLCEDDRLFLAMADPDDRRVVQEVELATGKRVFPYVALHGTLLEVIEQAYAALDRGESEYAGPLADSDAPSAVKTKPKPKPNLLPGGDEALVTSGDSLVGFEDELSRPLKLPTRGGVDDDFAGLTDSTEVAIPAASESAKRRILVVDDSDDIRELLVRVFRERDYEVFESARGLDALQKVRSCAPDVLVLDAMLPDVHGFDICRRIKGSRRYGHIPVIMVSAVYRGWRFAEDLKRSYGVAEFLEKPFRIGEILSAVERAIEGKGRSADGHGAEPEPVTGQAGDHLQAGIEAYSRGDVELAVGELKKGIAIDPLAFRLHYHLGLLYGKQENVFEAIEALEIATELRPRDFSTLKNLAVLYQRAGFRLKASELWERALGSAPDDATRANIKNHLMSLL
jgi:DNA-binding response OmpR family regulator